MLFRSREQITMTSKRNFKNVLLLVTVALLAASLVHCSKEILKNMTASFTKALEECKKEVSINTTRSLATVIASSYIFAHTNSIL